MTYVRSRYRDPEPRYICQTSCVSILPVATVHKDRVICTVTATMPRDFGYLSLKCEHVVWQPHQKFRYLAKTKYWLLRLTGSQNCSCNSQFSKHSATPLKAHQPAEIEVCCFFNFATPEKDSFQSFVQFPASLLNLVCIFWTFFHCSQWIKPLLSDTSYIIKPMASGGINVSWLPPGVYAHPEVIYSLPQDIFTVIFLFLLLK